MKKARGHARTKPRDQFKPPYSALALRMASATRPMAAGHRAYQLEVMRASLHALQFSDAPTHDNWRDCSDAINITDTIIGQGWAVDPDGLLQDAIDGMKRAGQLAQQGKPMRLDSDGAAAMSALLEDYEECLDGLCARDVMVAYNLTTEQIWAIQHGELGDAQVVAL